MLGYVDGSFVYFYSHSRDVMCWGVCTLGTQYAKLYGHLGDPWVIPIYSILWACSVLGCGDFGWLNCLYSGSMVTFGTRCAGMCGPLGDHVSSIIRHVYSGGVCGPLGDPCVIRVYYGSIDILGNLVPYALWMIRVF